LENTGQTIESALRYRDKVIMKEVLLEAGIRVPVFSAVESAQDIIEFYEKHGPKVGTQFLAPPNLSKVICSI
jgi:phosphoribosylaminoimidazole carboxylase (NCAIR synthetase)